jgi:hypothetical protein
MLTQFKHTQTHPIKKDRWVNHQIYLQSHSPMDGMEDIKHKKRYLDLELCRQHGYHSQLSKTHNCNHHTPFPLNELIKIKRRSKEVLATWMMVLETTQVTLIVWLIKVSWGMQFTTHGNLESQMCRILPNQALFTIMIQGRLITHSIHSELVIPISEVNWNRSL